MSAMNSLMTRSPAKEVVASASSKATAAVSIGVWEYGGLGVLENSLDMCVLIHLQLTLLRV